MSWAKNCGLEDDGAGACGTMLVDVDDVAEGSTFMADAIEEGAVEEDMSTGFGTLERPAPPTEEEVVVEEEFVTIMSCDESLVMVFVAEEEGAGAEAAGAGADETSSPL